MKKSIKSKLSQINSEDFNYSHIGEASLKQFLYLIEKKKDIDNLYQNKKERKFHPRDYFEEKEKEIDDDEFEKDEYGDDIFDKSYDAKYKKELKEKKEKYPLIQNSCSFIESTTKQGGGGNKKKQGKKNKEEKKAPMANIDYESENGRYKYHLIHHKHDYYIDKSIYNLNNQVSNNSYQPKLDLIFKKIIYSPEFGKMTGRYDQENKKDKIENKIDTLLKNQKEKEYVNYQKKLKKIRNLKLIPIPRNENEENFFQDKRPLKFRTIGDNNDSKKINPELIILRRNSKGSGENIDSSRNGISNLGKRSNSVLMNEPHLMEFNPRSDRTNKDSLFNIKSSEEENDKNSYNIVDEKKNMSNKLNENTLSTIDRNKTTSSKKKPSNFETEIIYPNISKNDSSNILIDNNYAIPVKRKKSFNTLNNLNYLVSVKKTDQTNSSNQPMNYILINKRYENSSDILSEKKRSMELSKVVNFEKMLSREYVNKLKQLKTNTYASLSPKYDAIKPRCIMKVVYAKKNNNKKYKKKEFKSDYNQIVFNIDKNFNNYNNHFPPKNIFLGKITGRKTDTILPSYMLDQYNRNSFNIFSEKSLKMNNFANGDFLPQKSSFNMKRTFNYKLIDQYTGNDLETIDEEINSIFRKATKYPINNKKQNYGELRSNSTSNIDIERNKNNNYTQSNLIRITKVPEYYQVNLDKYGKYPFSCGEKIDGFTLKTIKSSKSSVNLLSDHEKKIFLSKLDE